MSDKQQAADRKLWNSQAWTKRRKEVKGYRDEYHATWLGKTIPKRDRKQGDKVHQFPMGMNLTKLGVDIHRDLTRGMVEPDELLPVRASIRRGGDERIAEVERVLNEGVWIPSHGGPIQQEGLLSMGIYGATVYQIAFEPWNQSLPHRLRIRHLRDPGFVLPTWDDGDPWDMIECYIAYEITPEIAKLKYNVETKQPGPALYMEHWTRNTWEVRVNGMTPVIKWNETKWELKGENEWGIVPVVYIPHERTTELFGDSVIEGQEQLVRQINARTADLNTLVQSTRPGLLWGSDFDMNQVQVQPLIVAGETVSYIVNVGKTRAMPNAQPPKLNAMPVPDIPANLVGWPRELLDYWMLLSRHSPSSFGMDDTQSGRITGPAIQARMFSSIAHSTTCRINYNEGKTVLDRHILRILAWLKRNGSYDGLDGAVEPDIEPDDVFLSISQLWPPSLPLDKEKELEGLMARLKDSGISIEAYLKAMKVQDPEDERERIVAWGTTVAMMEAIAAGHLVPEEWDGTETGPVKVAPKEENDDTGRDQPYNQATGSRD